LKQKFGLERAQIMLNASHSHCTPVLRGALYDAYPLPADQKPIIERYSQELEAKIVDTVDKAFADLAPARIAAGQGITRFAVNRRNNPEGSVPKLIQENALKGPSDHSVPVLIVSTPDGALKSVVFGYACHNTTLSFYQWCGDYAGFAQIALERNHPGAVAMFFMGCGADQNPLPRREVSLAQRYGEMLAAAVEEVVLQNPARTRARPQNRARPHSLEPWADADHCRIGETRPRRRRQTADHRVTLGRAAARRNESRPDTAAHVSLSGASLATRRQAALDRARR
jgi:hypothetical protein